MSYSSLNIIDKWVEHKFGKPMEINLLDKIQEFAKDPPVEKPVKEEFKKQDFLDYLCDNVIIPEHVHFYECSDYKCKAVYFEYEFGFPEPPDGWFYCERCQDKFCDTCWGKSSGMNDYCYSCAAETEAVTDYETETSSGDYDEIE